MAGLALVLSGLALVVGAFAALVASCAHTCSCGYDECTDECGCEDHL